MMKSSGFTLIELVVTMAIMGILASIAMPSYRDYIIKSRRVEATTQLVQLQMAQEKFRGNNQTYASLAQLGLNPSSAYYAFAVTPNGDDYTLTASAVGEQLSDTKCAALAIAQTDSGIAYTPTICWK